MTSTVLRKELHEIIDTIPDQNLSDMKSHIAVFFNADYWDPVTEPASPEEIAQIESSMAEYRANPKIARPWAEVRKENP